MRRAADLQRGGLCDVPDAGGNVQLLGHHVVRGNRVGIGGRAQQLSGIGLDVPVFVGADDGGPVRGVHAIGGREGEGAAALGCDPYGGGAGHGCNLVHPGACGVDDDFGANAQALGQGEVPEVVDAGNAFHGRVAPQVAAALAQAADIALVQAVHVDIARTAIQKTVYQYIGVENGHQGLELLGTQALGIGGVDDGLCIGGIDQLFLRGGAHIEHAAWREDGRFGKACGRRVIEGAAGAGQSLNLGRAVMLFKQRGRAAGGVIAGLGFALQHQHGRGRVTAGLCQLPCGGGTGHARTHDDEIPHFFLHCVSPCCR